MTTNAQQLLEPVRAVLWTHLDPIGVNQGIAYNSDDPDAFTDEYNSYAFRLVEMMKSGVDRATLAKRLGQISKDAMRITPNVEKNAYVAQRLIELMSKER